MAASPSFSWCSTNSMALCRSIRRRVRGQVAMESTVGAHRHPFGMNSGCVRLELHHLVAGAFHPRRQACGLFLERGPSLNMSTTLRRRLAAPEVAVNSSNFGFGPVQRGHVKGGAETFLSNVKLQLGKTQASAPSAGDDLAGQLAKLAGMKAKGLLSDEEFAAAKVKLL